MKIRNLKSLIVIFVYFLLNAFIWGFALTSEPENAKAPVAARSLAPEFTEIEKLNYFHLKEGVPQISLAAEKMRSQGEVVAEFTSPEGVYNYQAKNKNIAYEAREGIYLKEKDILTLSGDVFVSSDEANYSADVIDYYFTKDLILGKGNVRFIGDDLKTRDKITIHSDKMRANPDAQVTKFLGQVSGEMERRKKYEGKITFSSQELLFKGANSLAHLQGDVHLKRDSYDIRSGKADIYLENFNKSLKYFDLNDDVKLTEKLKTPTGIQERKAYAERLEGFGREQKMILSGAPRVELGKDVIKGYRITIRENVDLIEVDDAMSDVQVKRAPKLKE